MDERNRKITDDWKVTPRNVLDTLNKDQREAVLLLLLSREREFGRKEGRGPFLFWALFLATIWVVIQVFNNYAG